MKCHPGKVGMAWPDSLALVLLVSLVGFQEVVELSQEGLALDTVYHAGLLNSLTAGRGAAQAVHADGKEQRSRLRCDIQNIANDGIFFDLNSHNMTSCYIYLGIITAAFEKNKGVCLIC